MEILKEFFANHSSELMQSLSDAGFSDEQAQEFLPEIGQGVQEAFSGRDLLSLLGGSDVGSIVNTLLERVDVAAIATKLGLDEAMVTDGIETLIPNVMELIDQEGGLSALLQGEGGLLGGIARLGSKFFK